MSLQSFGRCQLLERNSFLPAFSTPKNDDSSPQNWAFSLCERTVFWFKFSEFLGCCPSTVLRVALGHTLIYEGNETVLGTDNFCPCLAAQLPSPRGNSRDNSRDNFCSSNSIFSGVKTTLRDNVRDNLRDNLREGKTGTKIASGQWGDYF